MEAVGPAPSRHQAAGELVDDQHLPFLYHVVHVPLEQGMGAQTLVDVVKDLHIARIVEVVHLEELFHLEHPFLGEGGGLGLLVYGEIAGVGLPLARQGVRLDLLHLPLLEERDDPVDDVVLVGRILGRSRDNERGPRLVDQDRVHLVDDGIVEIALYVILQGKLHVVPEIVEAELVVGPVGDVGIVRLAPLVVVQAVDDHPHRKAEEAVEPPHPLGVAFCQVVVDRHHVDAAPGQGIEVGGQGCHQGLPLTGLHLGDLAGIEHHPADQLDVEVAHPQHPLPCLAANGKRLGKERVDRFPAGVTLLELAGFIAQLIVGKLGQLLLQGADPLHYRPELLQLPLVLAPDNLLDEGSKHLLVLLTGMGFLKVTG